MRFGEGSKVLVVLPTSIGDAVCAIPLLESLFKGGWVVHTVLDTRLAGLALTYSPYIQYEHLVPVKRWRSISPLRDLKGRLSFIARVRWNTYDAMISVGDGSLGAWIAWAARIPVSVTQDSYHKIHLKRWAQRCIYTHHVPVPRAHGIVQNCELGRPLGVIPVPPSFSRRDLVATAATRPPIFVIGPDASQAGRSIPLIETVLIVKRLKAAHPESEVVLAGPVGGIAEQAAQVCDVSRATIGASLAAVVRTIAEARCVIATDSGLGHIAAACDTPVVSIFGPGDPATAVPWIDPRKLAVIRNERPCQPCRENGCHGSGVADCLNGLPIDKIMEAAYHLSRFTVPLTAPD